MTRQIKFRMWSGILKVMYYPNLIERNLWTIPSSENGIIQNDEVNRIDPRNKLMQFTGIYDIKGKEIYEGDIDQYGCICYFYNGGFVLGKQGNPTFIPLQDANNIEIVGNIYETPDLL